jgi:lysosomal acid lipase/cholesteryl ester hydrolase
LNIFRIVDDSIKEKKGVVFLQHGVTDSADCWIMNFADVAPAFQLVRAGYDVWLGNQRGTKYSLGHTSLNEKRDKAYWEFSWTEMGKHDAPAQVDFVRSQTASDKIAFIGHSQGTTQMFYGISDDQEFW